jgi:hypothetical protein
MPGRDASLFVSGIIDHLRGVKDTSSQLTKLAPTVEYGIYIGLLSRLASHIVGGATADAGDLELHEAEEHGLLKSGLGMFGGMMGIAAKPKLSETSKVVLVVLGAVSPLEIRAVMNAFMKDKRGRQVHVVATRMANPDAVFEASFGRGTMLSSLGLAAR